MNNHHEKREAECVGFSRSLGTKLTFLVIRRRYWGGRRALIRSETWTRASGRNRRLRRPEL